MDSSALYVIFFFLGASGPVRTLDNSAVDVCRAAPSSIAQKERAKGASNTSAVRAKPLDCTPKTVALLRAPEISTAVRGTPSGLAQTREIRQPARPALAIVSPTLVSLALEAR
jgi:hypothetical protein